jgi:hypothetical protein
MGFDHTPAVTLPCPPCLSSVIQDKHERVAQVAAILPENATQMIRGSDSVGHERFEVAVLEVHGQVAILATPVQDLN